MKKKFDGTVGDKFARLTLEFPINGMPDHCARWVCRCECGKLFITRQNSILRGSTRSCGCLNQEVRKSGNNRRTHGMWGTRLHRIWKAMKKRCYNKNNPDYHDYGAKGITVCEEWLGFSTFAEWALKNGYRDDLSIDRIDFTKGYSPDNCRWATPTEQANNKSNNRRITINGETHTMAEWGRIANIPSASIGYRLRKGKQGSDLLAPVKRKKVVS